MNEFARFERQLTLAEIGLEGQKRIVSEVLHLPKTTPEEERDVAKAYALGAGFRDVTFSSDEEDLSSSREVLVHFRHAATKAVALGARRVLLPLRTLLSLDPPL